MRSPLKFYPEHEALAADRLTSLMIAAVKFFEYTSDYTVQYPRRLLSTCSSPSNLTYATFSSLAFGGAVVCLHGMYLRSTGTLCCVAGLGKCSSYENTSSTSAFECFQMKYGTIGNYTKAYYNSVFLDVAVELRVRASLVGAEIPGAVGQLSEVAAERTHTLLVPYLSYSTSTDLRRIVLQRPSVGKLSSG